MKRKKEAATGGSAEHSKAELDNAAESVASTAEPLYVKLTINSYDCLRRGIAALQRCRIM